MFVSVSVCRTVDDADKLRVSEAAGEGGCKGRGRKGMMLGREYRGWTARGRVTETPLMERLYGKVCCGRVVVDTGIGRALWPAVL